MAKHNLNAICTYCGSADGIHPEYYQAAHEMGRELARRGIHLVFGGGKTGLMGAVADGALRAGGEVTGVIPENLNRPQLVHAGLTRLEVCDTIHTRKARMSVLADAFIALPGGYGTLDELFETLTWSQIGLHQKPIGLLNTRGYFDPLLAMIERARSEGFIYEEHRQLLCCTTEPEQLLENLLNFTLPHGLNRWVDR